MKFDAPSTVGERDRPGRSSVRPRAEHSAYHHSATQNSHYRVSFYFILLKSPSGRGGGAASNPDVSQRLKFIRIRVYRLYSPLLTFSDLYSSLKTFLFFHVSEDHDPRRGPLPGAAYVSQNALFPAQAVAIQCDSSVVNENVAEFL